jgi:EAL domain-containing protein (putative c-di-GMP-specific phosphodiesterase class I)
LIQGLGLTALAEGIDDERDLAALWALGFDGATGPAVHAQVEGAPESVS